MTGTAKTEEDEFHNVAFVLYNGAKDRKALSEHLYLRGLAHGNFYRAKLTVDGVRDTANVSALLISARIKGKKIRGGFDTEPSERLSPCFANTLYELYRCLGGKL